jgi:prepilin-type N-terminal cleavage/methylation domain-containing protein
MSAKSRRLFKLASKPAFTLVELLVVIAIIGVLVGLLLPAINAARERARQTTCLNNQRNIGVAMINFATKGTKGAYPGWMQLERMAKGAADHYPVTTGANVPSDIDVSWAGKLLPELDNQASWTSLLEGTLGTGGTNYTQDALPRIDIFICPSDTQTNATAPVLTYIANTGCPDLNTNGVPSDDKANGMSHNLVRDPALKVRSGADIPDGADRTLLTSENINKDQPGTPGVASANSWLRSSAFGGGSQEAEQYFGMVWTWPISTQVGINQDVPPSSGSYMDDGPRYARPSAAHSGLFIVTMAGGSARSIKSDIDYIVYQQLLTPNGRKLKWLEDRDLEAAMPKAFFNADPANQLSDDDLE